MKFNGFNLLMGTAVSVFDLADPVPKPTLKKYKVLPSLTEHEINASIKEGLHNNLVEVGNLLKAEMRQVKKIDTKK